MMLTALTTALAAKATEEKISTPAKKKQPVAKDCITPDPKLSDVQRITVIRIDHEKSRNQYLVRGVGRSYVCKYGENGVSQEQAHAKAVAWLAREKAKIAS